MTPVAPARLAHWPALDGIRERGRRLASRYSLLAWFVIVDLHYWWTHGIFWAGDVLIYQGAAGQWLAGGDPWAYAIEKGGSTFSSTPPTLLLFAPVSFLPQSLAVVLGLGLVIFASVRVLRTLGLPLWWLAFPPVFLSIAYGNIMPVLLWLLLIDRPWATALATFGKAFAIIPALVSLKWRHLFVTAAALAVTAPMWPAYLARGTSVDAILDNNWNGSAWFDPLLLLAPAVIAILVLRKREGPWLAIPALWVGTNLTYAVFALPVLAGSQALAFLLATPLHGVPAIAAILMALPGRMGVVRSGIELGHDADTGTASPARDRRSLRRSLGRARPAAAISNASTTRH